MLQEGSNDANVITLTESGVIYTSEKTDLACIHARDRSTGRSEIAACVRVAEVNALLLQIYVSSSNEEDVNTSFTSFGKVLYLGRFLLICYKFRC